VLVARNAEEA